MANTYEEARDELTAFIRTQWELVDPTAPLFYDQVGAERPSPPEFFGRVTVRFFSGTRATLGSNSRFRRVGRVFVQIFNPNDSGMEALDRMGQALVASLEDAGAVGNIWFRDIGERDVGTDGTYYQINTEADFIFDRLT